MREGGRRIRMVLAYDGTGFAGWQYQPRLRTVQGELLAVLEKLQGGGRIRLRGAGRTDTGVHAECQVADCMIRCRLDDAGMLQALRKLLPEDLRPLRLETVDAGFHSQYMALGKTYRYVLDHSPHGDPFAARYSCHCPARLDFTAMAEALRKLPGERDWSGFAGIQAPEGNRVRNLTEASMTHPAETRTVFRFSADGFLNHMVRNIVGALLGVGEGRFGPERIDRILESGDRHMAGKIAPARGLTLESVRYEPPIPTLLR